MLPSSVPICLFWTLYALRSTVLADSGTIQGLYYPLYLIIIVTAAKDYLSFRQRGEARLWLTLYGIFLFSTVWGVFRNQYLQIDFQSLQLLFIYSLGLLTFFQFTSERSWRVIRMTLVLTSVTVSSWVVFTYLTSTASIVYRGGINVNANYASMIIVVGAIIIANSLIGQVCIRQKLIIVSWILLSFYALSLLGSRGMSIAFLVGIICIALNNLRRFNAMVCLLLLTVVVFLILPELPGSDMLLRRFSGANIGTLNERTIIWQGCLAAFERGSFLDMLFGFGFRASEGIVASIFGGLYTSTHNGYLRILFEQGIVGLSAFLALLALILRRLWLERVNGVEALALVAALAVANLSGSETDVFLFWIVLGAVAAYTFKMKSKKWGGTCGKSV